MKTKALIALGVTVFGLAFGPALAGPCTTSIDDMTKTLAAKDAGSGPTSGASAGTQPAATPPGQHPATSVMDQQVAGTAASSEDVRRQTQGQPTAAQQGNTAATGASLSEATAALQRARDLDGQGKEAECMAAIQQARQLAGASN